MKLLDRLILIALGVAIIACLAIGAWSYHEHTINGKLQLQNTALSLAVSDARLQQKQAEADRDSALKAAAAAETQRAAIESAMSSQATDLQSAQKFEKMAREKLATLSKDPATAKILNTRVPKQIWDALYSDGDK